MQITLRSETRDSLKTLKTILEWATAEEPVELQTIIQWLNTSSLEELAVEKALAFVLKDIAQSLPVKRPERDEKSQKINKKWAWVSYVFLGIAGIFYAALEGFDSMTALTSLFAMPAAIALGLGIVLATVSVFVFMSFELTLIAENLGVSRKEVNERIDAYLEQIQWIEHISQAMADMDDSKNPDYPALSDLFETLKKQQEKLKTKMDDYDGQKAQAHLYWMRKIVGVVTGATFFLTGAFTGQAGGLFVLSLFLGAMGASSAPAIIFFVLGGLAASAIYFYSVRPQIEKLASKTMGLDMEKWEALGDKVNQVDAVVKLAHEKAKNTSIVQNSLFKPSTPAFIEETRLVLNLGITA